jgi:hypothetical protein
MDEGYDMSSTLKPFYSYPGYVIVAAKMLAERAQKYALTVELRDEHGNVEESTTEHIEFNPDFVHPSLERRLKYANELLEGHYGGLDAHDIAMVIHVFEVNHSAFELVYSPEWQEYRRRPDTEGAGICPDCNEPYSEHNGGGG